MALQGGGRGGGGGSEKLNRPKAWIQEAGGEHAGGQVRWTPTWLGRQGGVGAASGCFARQHVPAGAAGPATSKRICKRFPGAAAELAVRLVLGS